MSDYLSKLLETHPMRVKALEAAVAGAGFPPASRGLDAGCGIGLVTTMLAEALGDGTRITGVDISAEFVDYANRRASESAHARTLDFRRASITETPFEDDTFDWAWSSKSRSSPIRQQTHNVVRICEQRYGRFLFAYVNTYTSLQDLVHTFVD